MATTTNFGWTTPDDTALVKDGASAIRTLGSSIDTTLKAQIDAQIPDTLLTTTGDIIYASAANTPARLGIGSSGQSLVVSGGLPVWSTPASGAYTLLSTTSLSGTSITISGISQSYKHLYCVYYGLNAGGNWNTTCAPNNSGADWWQGGLNGNSAFEINASAFNIFGSAVAGGSNTNNGSFTIFNYSSTVANKSFLGSARFNAVSLGGIRGSIWGGASATAGAITSLVIAQGTALTAGTFLVYGVN